MYYIYNNRDELYKVAYTEKERDQYIHDLGDDFGHVELEYGS